MMRYMKRAEKRSQALASLTKTQRERLSHIDFKLYFLESCDGLTSSTASGRVLLEPPAISLCIESWRRKT